MYCTHFCSPNGPTQAETTTLTVDVQKGMRDGEQIIFEEVADEAAGHKAGDLVLTIETQPHPDITRRGDDLYLDMDISLLDALTGFTTSFKHLDGRDVPVTRTGVTGAFALTYPTAYCIIAC
jgi:DnaJ-class molecular chaperone